VVERGGLENRCALTGTVGSNPTLSAREFSNLKIEIRDLLWRGRLIGMAPRWKRGGSKDLCGFESRSLRSHTARRKSTSLVVLFRLVVELSGSGLRAILTVRTPPGPEGSNGSTVRMCRGSHRSLSHLN
jgi:hypothetical protein